MKRRVINENKDWNFWVPDSIADWDAPSHWERERLASMQRHLKPGMVLYDIGVEHGWLSAVYGGFVGHENMVLVEPSPEFWPNIRMTWQHNGFPGPLAAYVAFAGDKVAGEPFSDVWPAAADGPECGAMAYRYIGQHVDIPTITIDRIAVENTYEDWESRAIDRDGTPDAITIDIEGAELLALQGATDVLEQCRPLVWISIHPDLMERDFGYTDTELHIFMAEMGYHGKHIHTDHEEHWLFTPGAP